MGDDSDTPEYSSANHSQSDNSTIYPFKPQTLSNLSLQSEMETLHPLLDSKVATKDGEDSPFIYTISGRGTRGEFKVLKRGLEATEMVEYPFPGNPIAVWSVKSKKSGIINLILNIDICR